MSNKYSKTITVLELKEQIKKRLEELAPQLDSHDRMQIAINLKIELVTVKRYMDSSMEDMRRLELAEQILIEGEKVLAAKQNSVTMK